MNTPHISCYQPNVGLHSFTFYVLANGLNAGQPSLSPWEKCYSVQCSHQECFDFYFWLALTLHQTGQTQLYLQGQQSTISIEDLRFLLVDFSESIYLLWQHQKLLTDSLNQLRTARVHLSDYILSTEKLQGSLLNFHL